LTAALVPLFLTLALVSPGLAVPTEEVTLGLLQYNRKWVDESWYYDEHGRPINLWKYPWVLPGGGIEWTGKTCRPCVLVLPPDKREFQLGRLLLVAPLWREDEHYRVFLASYRIKELPMPPQTKVYRVLVPSGVKVKSGWLGRVVTRGPWREVQYSLSERGKWLVLKPSGDNEVFVVEASLPARGEWVRLILPPGSWLLALGWSKDFNVLTLDGRVLFRGRAPYDEVEYDLGPVRLVFWYAWYLLNLSDKDDYQVKLKVAKGVVGSIKYDHFGNTDFVFDPRAQYEERAFYGPCTLLRLDAKIPVILEFKTPKPGAEAFDYVGMAWEDARGFYSRKYFERHHTRGRYHPPLSNAPALVSWLLLTLLAVQRARRTSSTHRRRTLASRIVISNRAVGARGSGARDSGVSRWVLGRCRRARSGRSCPSSSTRPEVPSRAGRGARA